MNSFNELISEKLHFNCNIQFYSFIAGVGFFLRKIGNQVSPTVFLTKEGDEFSFTTESTFKTSVIKFKLGQESEQDTLDEKKIPTTFSLEGNTLTQTEKRDKPSVIVREFSDSELVVKCTFGDVVSTRWYKVV